VAKTLLTSALWLGAVGGGKIVSGFHRNLR
jgi:hypothetical protein